MHLPCETMNVGAIDSSVLMEATGNIVGERCFIAASNVANLHLHEVDPTGLAVTLVDTIYVGAVERR